MPGSRPRPRPPTCSGPCRTSWWPRSTPTSSSTFEPAARRCGSSTESTPNCGGRPSASSPPPTTPGRTVLILTGPEPDMRWHQFIAEVVQLASRLEAKLVVGLGAFPAPVPHTRPVRLVGTSTEAELAGQIGYLPAAIDVPSGVQGALEFAFGEAKIPAVGLWARVPHYVSAMPYPAAAAALLDGLARVADLELDTVRAPHRGGVDPPADREADRGQRGARRPGSPAGGPARAAGGARRHGVRRPALRRRAGRRARTIPARRALTSAAPPAAAWPGRPPSSRRRSAATANTVRQISSGLDLDVKSRQHQPAAVSSARRSLSRSRLPRWPCGSNPAHSTAILSSTMARSTRNVRRPTRIRYCRSAAGSPSRSQRRSMRCSQSLAPGS